MNHRNWREMAEVVGFVTIVAVLLVMAIEQRTANRIATRSAEFEVQWQLATMYSDLFLARAGNPEIAKVFAKLSAPQGQLITATDASQIRAIAQQYLNIYRTAQVAYDSGMLPQARYEQLQTDLQAAIDRYPGMHAALVSLYEAIDDPESLPILAPLAELARSRAAVTGD